MTDASWTLGPGGPRGSTSCPQEERQRKLKGQFEGRIRNPPRGTSFELIPVLSPLPPASGDDVWNALGENSLKALFATGRGPTSVVFFFIPCQRPTTTADGMPTFCSEDFLSQAQGRLDKVHNGSAPASPLFPSDFSFPPFDFPQVESTLTGQLLWPVHRQGVI